MAHTIKIPHPSTTPIVTYREAYRDARPPAVPQEHRRSPRALGPVLHGEHRGLCDACQVVERAAKAADTHASAAGAEGSLLLTICPVATSRQACCTTLEAEQGTRTPSTVAATLDAQSHIDE